MNMETPLLLWGGGTFVTSCRVDSVCGGHLSVHLCIEEGNRKLRRKVLLYSIYI